MTLIEQFQKQIDIALMMQRACVEDNSGISYMLIETSAGEITLCAFTPDFMATPASRNALAAAMRAQILELHAKVAVFCADAWYARLPPDIDKASMPGNMELWPPEFRGETLICVVNAIGHKGMTARQGYSRSSDGQLVWEPLETHLSVEWSRFSFDLTEVG